jgi:hypothetical protein
VRHVHTGIWMCDSRVTKHYDGDFSSTSTGGVTHASSRLSRGQGRQAVHGGEDLRKQFNLAPSSVCFVSVLVLRYFRYWLGLGP